MPPVASSLIDLPDPFYITEDVRIFRDMVWRFMEREMVPRADAWERNRRVDRESWLAAGAAGLLVPRCPQALGGAGGGVLHDVVIVEAAVRLGVEGLNIATQNMVVAPYLLRYGSPEQQRRWLPGLASGELIGAIAITEPGAGSDMRAIRTSARRKGHTFVINGRKMFVTNGHSADLIMVACRTGDDGELSLIYLETDQLEGFVRGRILDKIGMHAHDTAELYFDDTRVPVENLLGEREGEGFSQMTDKLAEERMLVAIQSLAMIERALEETVAYARERRAFGRRLVDFQNAHFRLAELLTGATVGKAFLQHCIAALIQGTLSAEMAAMAKYWLSDLQGRVVDECLQLFGGYGYINEFPIARMYRDARVSRIYGGTNEIMKLVISRRLR